MAMLKLSSCLLDNTRDTSVMHEIAKYVCFIYMQPQKVKFKFVQINMKQVSYMPCCRSILNIYYTMLSTANLNKSLV